MGRARGCKSLEQAWESILTQGYRTHDLYSQDTETLVTTTELVELFIHELRLV
ncbi:MAG: hypothetical protein HC936_12685 [Leptolyngbyaceae cyanobacterium SU_3_3]|nr:hypothetical protein [Leptolyngbyaceae cyanobacterium SU_3_3]